MSNRKANVTVQFPVLFFLFLTFLVLKLTEVIDWSWWWVTAPLWIPFALLVAILVIAAIIWLCCKSLVARRHRRLRQQMLNRYR